MSGLVEGLRKRPDDGPDYPPIPVLTGARTLEQQGMALAVSMVSERPNKVALVFARDEDRACAQRGSFYGGELLRRQWVVGTAARFADFDDTIDHELALVCGSPQRHLLLDVSQRNAKELLLFLARWCWKDDEAGVYGLSLAEPAEIPEVVRYKGSVLVDAMS